MALSFSGKGFAVNSNVYFLFSRLGPTVICLRSLAVCNVLSSRYGIRRDFVDSGGWGGREGPRRNRMRSYSYRLFGRTLGSNPGITGSRALLICPCVLDVFDAFSSRTDEGRNQFIDLSASVSGLGRGGECILEHINKAGVLAEIESHIRCCSYALSPFAWVLISKLTLALELGQPRFLCLKFVLARNHLQLMVSYDRGFDVHVTKGHKLVRIVVSDLCCSQL